MIEVFWRRFGEGWNAEGASFVEATMGEVFSEVGEARGGDGGRLRGDEDGAIAGA